LSELHPKLARALVNIIYSDKWQSLLKKEIELKSLRLHKRIKARIEEAIILNERVVPLINRPKNINMNLTNLKDNYTYKKYIVDKSCCLDCAFTPCEEKKISGVTTYKETLALDPYSVVLITIDRESRVSDVSKETDSKTQPEAKELIPEKADGSEIQTTPMEQETRNAR